MRSFLISWKSPVLWHIVDFVNTITQHTIQMDAYLPTWYFRWYIRVSPFSWRLSLGCFPIVLWYGLPHTILNRSEIPNISARDHIYSETLRVIYNTGGVEGVHRTYGKTNHRTAWVAVRISTSDSFSHDPTHPTHQHVSLLLRNAQYLILVYDIPRITLNWISA